MLKEFKESCLLTLTLVSSLSTLICCTLPILFVALGFGSALAFLSLQMTWWIVLAKYKFWLFFSSGLLIIFSYLILQMTNKMPCPTDPQLAKKCRQIRWWNVMIFRFSVFIWVIGFISAYLAIPISSWLNI